MGGLASLCGEPEAALQSPASIVISNCTECRNWHLVTVLKQRETGRGSPDLSMLVENLVTNVSPRDFKQHARAEAREQQHAVLFLIRRLNALSKYRLW